MSTGLDPNTHQDIRAMIQQVVAGFVTEDERSLSETGIGDAPIDIQIRYWFYPDEIQTVTDGRIGAIETCQFMADAERMDQRSPLGRAQRETIDHLNQNFDQYAKALPTFRELKTVGRMMAIANWLYDNKAASHIDLDALLSIELPAFSTPRHTKKLLAVTTYGESSSHGIRSGWVYFLDKFLDSLSPSASDADYLAAANKLTEERADRSMVPSDVRRAYESLYAAKMEVETAESRLEALSARIERERPNIDPYSESAVARFNSMVDEYNSIQRKYETAVDAYNRAVGRVGERAIVSVSGGINLSPTDFAKPLTKPDFPLLRGIRSARGAFERNPASAVDGLVRSESGPPNTMPPSSRPARIWQSQPVTTTGNLVTKRWTSVDQATALLEASPESGYARSRVETSRYFSETTVKSGGKWVAVSSSMYPAEILFDGDVMKGQTVFLHRGKMLTPDPRTPVW